MSCFHARFGIAIGVSRYRWCEQGKWSVEPLRRGTEGSSMLKEPSTPAYPSGTADSSPLSAELVVTIQLQLTFG
jgi:hypothetical protein